jgi:hypothetical protein
MCMRAATISYRVFALVSSNQILSPQSGWLVDVHRTNEGGIAAPPCNAIVLPPTLCTVTGVYLRDTWSGGIVSSTVWPSAWSAGTAPLPRPVSNLAGVAGDHCAGVSTTRPSNCSPWYLHVGRQRVSKRQPCLVRASTRAHARVC